MKVRYIREHRWFKKNPGDIADESEGVAKTLIANGFCEAVEEDAKAIDAPPMDKAIRRAQKNKAVASA